jgi:NADPH:quinone reductase-like Zn-dependent oxidoreductase
MRAYNSENRKKGEAAPIELVERSIPEPDINQVQIKVVAIGVNRADLFIRQGLYPLRDGIDSDILGSEVSGIITSIGLNVTNWQVGDEVCTITPFGAAYAEYVVVSDFYPFKKPRNISFEEAASLPIGLATAWHNIIRIGNLQEGESLLVQGGASGMGVLAIQLAQVLGASVIATAGGEEHCKFCSHLGAKAVDYKAERFEEYGPYDVIYDILGGGEYLARNIRSLKDGGRLTILSFIAGAKTDSGLYLGKIYNEGGFVQFSKARLLAVIADGELEGETEFFAIAEKLKLNTTDVITIGGDVRRRWNEEETRATLDEVRTQVMPMVETGKIKPIVDSVYDIRKAEDAHKKLTSSQGHIGKVILTI